MAHNIKNNYFIKNFFCYTSPHIYEANMLIVWGYISPKLARLLSDYYILLPKNIFILHINICDKFLDNYNYQALNIPFNFNAKITCMNLDKAHVRGILKEARQCLQA
jgi:hypothetical protein